MKKIIIFSLTFQALFLSGLAGSVLASETCPQNTFPGLCNIQVGADTPLIGNVISLLLFAAVALALIFLLIGGIRWILSGGDKAKVDAARSTMTAAVIGLILAFLTFFIISVIGFVFGVNGILNIKIPQLV